MSVISDIIKGSSGRVTRTGYEFERVYVVSQLSGDAESILAYAVTTAGVPRVGEPHPTIHWCYVEEVYVEPESTTIARVRVVYRNPSSRVGPSGISIEYNSSRSSKTTDKDKEGKELWVTYNGEPHRHGSIDVPTTERSIMVTYVTADDPENEIDTFDDSVNSAGWHGEEPRCWHCVASARSSNNGVTWEVRFEFYLNRATWDRLLEYYDEQGKIPDDATETNGRAFARCIRESNFMALPFHV